MHKLSAILILLLLSGCAGRTGVSSGPTPVPIPGPIHEQAEEFRRLRAVQGHFNGGEIHTCGPVSGGIVESFAAHKNIKSFDFFFVTPDKTRTTRQLRELKQECRGRVVMNAMGMVFDEDSFTVDFVRELREGGGVIFTGVVGSQRQVARWCEIVQSA